MHMLTTERWLFLIVSHNDINTTNPLINNCNNNSINMAYMRASKSELHAPTGLSLIKPHTSCNFCAGDCPNAYPFRCINSYNQAVCFADSADALGTCGSLSTSGNWCALEGASTTVISSIGNGKGIWCSGTPSKCRNTQNIHFYVNTLTTSFQCPMLLLWYPVKIIHPIHQ